MHDQNGDDSKLKIGIELIEYLENRYKMGRLNQVDMSSIYPGSIREDETSKRLRFSEYLDSYECPLLGPKLVPEPQKTYSTFFKSTLKPILKHHIIDRTQITTIDDCNGNLTVTHSPVQAKGNP